jgi:3-hydroxybutyryl-CoA dehydrogenase
MAVIGVVGLGTMGLGIAQVYAAAGNKVLAIDGHAPTRDSAMERMTKTLERRVAAGKLSQKSKAETLARFSIVENLTKMKDCDLVIEAIVEKLEAKQTLFKSLEEILPKTTILATNTSALSVSDIAAPLERPGNLLGLHFFNPAPAMKLVELVTRPENGKDVIAFAQAITENAGKTVVECADRPGFIVNRCARPFYGEALAMLEEGRTAIEIDAAMLAAGYRLGPFSLIDLIGADINLAATKGLYEGMGGNPRYFMFQSLVDQVAAGNLGAKTGNGFLTGVKVEPVQNDAIVRRIEATLANEAASLLDEGDQTPDAIDLAMKLALNYPRGPFESAKNWGASAICDELRRLAASAPPYLAKRYEISPSLAAM